MLKWDIAQVLRLSNHDEMEDEGRAVDTIGDVLLAYCFNVTVVELLRERTPGYAKIVP